MSGATGPDSEDPDLLAAEYVIGALTQAEARAVEALALTDATVAASIGAWEDRLSPLADAVPPMSPPPAVWRRLALAAGLDSMITAPPAPRRSGASRVWRSPGLWRATTVGSMAVAASLAFLLFSKPVPGPEPLMAALTPYNQPGATFLIRVGPNGVATVVAVGDSVVPQGRSLQLWAVAAGASAPVSMGLLPESGRAQLTIPLPQGTQLLVSQEPPGGSPTNLPTGPVVYAGKLTGI